MVTIGTAERRKTDTAVVEVLREMREWLSEHEAMDDAKYSELRAQMQAEREDSERRHGEIAVRMEKMSQSTFSAITEQNNSLREIKDLFKRSFPDGDGETHRIAHEKWIKKAEADEQFWLKLKQHVINWAVVAVIGWGGIALWLAFLRGPA